jgi:tetratricopeptide (TPR) repeat protein
MVVSMNNARSAIALAIAALLLGGASAALARSEVRSEDRACADTVNTEAAIAACTRLAENRGLGKRNRAIALGNRGAAYKMLGRYDEAIADFDRASELDPDNPQYYCQRGDVRLRLNEVDAAIEDYSAALQRSPKSVWAHQGRGRAYLAKGEGEMALLDLNEALRSKPGNMTLLVQRGRANNVAKRYGAAVADLSKAMSDPAYGNMLPKERAAILAQRAYAYAKQKQIDEARGDADEAVRLAPRDAFAIGVSGLVAEQEDDTERARDAYTRALAIEPNLALAKAGLERLDNAGGQTEQETSELPARENEPEPEPTPRPSGESSASRDMCAKYIPEIGRTVRVKCAE